MMYQDRFGFIPRRHTIEWSGGRIEPTDEHSEAREAIEEWQDSQRFLHPPIKRRVRVNPDNPDEPEPIPGTERPAHMHRLPATHRIQIYNLEGETDDIRRGPSGFVIHFLGMLLGYRCEFWNWFVDGRVSMRKDNDLVIGIGMSDPVLGRGVATWSDWPEREQRILVNALYMHNRMPGLHWDWERFQSEYQVFDAIYRVANRRHNVTASGHGDRWRAMADEFGLFPRPDLWEQIVDLRNDLVHEVLWAGEMPTYVPDERSVFHLPIYMRNFTCRLFLGVLGVGAGYIGTDWKNLGQYGLDLPDT